MLIRNFIWLFMPLIVQSQVASNDVQKLTIGKDKKDQTVQWMNNLAWEQILQKAKAENKYVFVDFYTTWCAPCKAMDKYVYTDRQVGTFMNEKFVSIKVQMDKTSWDDPTIKAWYKRAETFNEQYKIDAYPTLIFFSPDGKLAHRVSQGLNVDGFMEVATTALDPQKRYYSKLAEYEEGKSDLGFLKDLIGAAKAANDRKTAERVAEKYISSLLVKNLFDKENRDIIRQFHSGSKAAELSTAYINLLKQNEIFSLDNLIFIQQFTLTSKDRGFKVFYNNREKVNNIVNNSPIPPGAIRQSLDFAGDVVRRIIYKEDVYPMIKSIMDSSSNLAPNWQEIEATINKKYPKTNAERIIVDAKVNWYQYKKNWPEYSKSLLQQMDMKLDISNLKNETFAVNNFCWDLFERALDSSILNRAIYWMEQAFKQNQKDLKWSTAIDTYANLLYKVNRKKEALKWEAKAIEYEPNNRNFTQAFENMKKGLPTWPHD